MKAKCMAAAWLCVAALFCSAYFAGAQDEAAPGEAGVPPDVQPAPAAGERIQMVEIDLDGRTVRGRLLGEGQAAITIEGPTGGAVAYPKDAIRDVRRFTVSASAYYDERGDLHHERAWGADDAPAGFQKARLAYERALAAASSDEDRARLENKLQSLANDVEEWQKEAVRQEGLNKARHEAELARLQTELTKQQLDAYHQQVDQIRELRGDLGRTQQEIRRLASTVDALEHKVDLMEDDLADATRGGRAFVTVNMYEDLRRALSMLERKVDRLESRVGSR